MLSPELLTHARRRQNQLFVLLGVIYLVTVGLGIGIATFAHDREHQDDQASLGLILLLFCIPAAIVLAGLGAMVLARNRGARWIQPVPLLGADRATRKRVRKALKAGQHLEGQDEELAVDTARRIIRQARLQYWLIGIFACNVVVQVLIGNYWVAGLNAVLLLWLPVLQHQNTKRARRYLETSDSAALSEEYIG